MAASTTSEAWRCKWIPEIRVYWKRRCFLTRTHISVKSTKKPSSPKWTDLFRGSGSARYESYYRRSYGQIQVSCITQMFKQFSDPCSENQADQSGVRAKGLPEDQLKGPWVHSVNKTIEIEISAG